MNVKFVDRPVRLLGSGSALPGRPVSTPELVAHLGEMCGPRAARKARAIAHRLGIRSRHLSRDLRRALSGTRPTMEAPRLCADALAEAFSQAGTSAKSTDYLIGHTTSPHTLLPPNVSWVADLLRYDGPYFELRQACTGFAPALQIAAAMIHAGQAQRTAIVGSETGSPYFRISGDFLSTEQLINYVQMGDGAGAVVVGPDDGGGRGQISEIFFGHLGPGSTPGFSLEGGGSAFPAAGPGFPQFRHEASQVRDHGAELIRSAAAAISERGHSLETFDWIIPHQANGRLAELVAEGLGVRRERVVVNADQLGNLGSAAIWVSLDRLRRSARLEPGQRVLVLGAEASKYLFGGFIYRH